MAKGKSAVEGKITGRLIIEQLVRNMELGQFEMGYSILLPCILVSTCTRTTIRA